MGRLIAELARRRNKWMVLLLVAGAAPLWIFASELPLVGQVFGLSMGVAFAIGPGMGLQFMPQPIWYLPVSRRDIWRANWVVATLGATGLITGSKLLALTLPSVRESIGFEGLVLSTLYDFAATGLGCALVIVATRPRPARGMLHGPWPAFKAIAVILLLQGMLAGMASSLWLQLALPARWADLTTSGIVVLMAGVALTIVTYFHSPVPVPQRPASAPTTRARVASRRFKLAGVSGLPRLLVHEYAWTLTIGGVLATACSLLVFILAKYAPKDALEFLTGAFLATDGNRSPSLTGGFAAFNLLMWYAFFASTLVARFPEMIRHLTVLPVGKTRVNALLLGWPALIWLSVWAALGVLRFVIGGGLTFLPAALLIGVIGLSALVQSMTLRLNSALKALAFAVAVGGIPFLHFLTLPAPPVLVAFGIGSLAAAAFINHLALSRSATYRIPFLTLQAQR